MGRTYRFRPRSRPRSRKALGFTLLGVSLGVVLAWTLGFLVFVANLPRAPVDPERRTDAIVVLTGGSGRFDQGLNLLASGVAEELFVSGVHEDVRVEELLNLSPAAPLPEVSTCCIVLGHQAQTTYGNAQETAAWIANKDYHSLRLVTASYHMPRSLLEFRRAMPTVEILPHPVFPDHVRQDDWWRWRNSALLLAAEYTKYLGAQLRALLPELP